MAKSFIVTTVVENELVAQNTYRMRIACPELASTFRPGQFCMIRKPGANDPLLGRPFAIYDLWQDESETIAGVDVMYLVVGKATTGFAELLPGQPIEIWGPLGNGFSLDSSIKHLIMLAGGIGQTPFLTLAKEALRNGCNAVPKITLCYGARSKDAFAGLDDFKKLGIDLWIFAAKKKKKNLRAKANESVLCPRSNVAGNADGVWAGNLLYLRCENPGRFRRVGLQTNLQRRPRFRRQTNSVGLNSAISIFYVTKKKRGRQSALASFSS